MCDLRQFRKMFECRDWFLRVLPFLVVFFVGEVCSIQKSEDADIAVFRSTDTVDTAMNSDRHHRAMMLTESEKQAVVDRHNDLRRREGASNMQKIKWNEFLADMAAEWVNGCVFAHGQPPRDKKDLPFQYIGQNLFYIPWPRDLVWSTDGYFTEKKHFTYDSNSCEKGRVCGHYTQVVWSSTTDIGCAIAFCNSSQQWWFHACNYGLGGNVVGVKPYEKGSACSKCDGNKWCEDGLCNSECDKSQKNCECAAACENCGTVDPETCTCNCADGWQGPDCTVQCLDNVQKCKGFSTWYCSKYQYVRDKCPVLCGSCKASNVTIQPTCETNRITKHNDASNYSNKEFQV